jgi:hypothetical protein
MPRAFSLPPDLRQRLEGVVKSCIVDATRCDGG